MNNKDIEPIKVVLNNLKREGKVLIALLYGSYFKGTNHKRSDIDLALYLKAEDEKEEMEIIDRIFMFTDKEISILRLDDEEESPFVIQEALKGMHLIEPDKETLYAVSRRVLYECEDMRFRRGVKVG